MLPQPADGSSSAIDELYATWREAFRRGDVAATLALVTPDYELWYPGLPPIGPEVLRRQLESTFVTYEIESSFERVECLVSGSLAIDRGWDAQVIRPRGGGQVRTLRQRVMLVLRQDADGRWRFARGMAQPGPATT